MCKLVARVALKYEKHETSYRVAEWKWHTLHATLFHNPLIFYISMKCYHGVRYLHENGFHMHTDVEYPLRIAAYRDDHMIIKYLIDNGADIDIAIKYATLRHTRNVLQKYHRDFMCA